jgi:hypothetical protein
MKDLKNQITKLPRFPNWAEGQLRFASGNLVNLEIWSVFLSWLAPRAVTFAGGIA